MPSKHRRSKHTQHTQHTLVTKSTRGAGCVLAAVCYGFLAFMLSLTPARFLWWLMVVLVIPVLIGAVAVRGTSRIDTPIQRFRKAFWTCAIPMFLYVGITLMVTHYRVGLSGNAGGEFFAGIVAACVYTLPAGIVAGLAGILIYRQADRRESEA